MTSSRGVALVTGAGGRLGRVVVARLSRAGLACALVGRRVEPLEQAAEACGGATWVAPCDVREPEAVGGVVEGVVARWGRLDVVVHAAALLAEPAGQAVSAWEHFDCVLRTNVRGGAVVAEAAAPAMGRAGLVVMVGSSVARLPTPDALAYGASKAALEHLVASLDARYQRRQGPRVVCLAPGPLWGASGGISPCEDVAEAVIYLLSRWGQRVRGTTLFLDGGESVHGTARRSAGR